jgi:hypothetical protein
MVNCDNRVLYIFLLFENTDCTMSNDILRVLLMQGNIFSFNIIKTPLQGPGL